MRNDPICRLLMAVVIWFLLQYTARRCLRAPGITLFNLQKSYKQDVIFTLLYIIHRRLCCNGDIKMRLFLNLGHQILIESLLKLESSPFLVYLQFLVLTLTEVVSGWKTSISCENHPSWVLEWYAVFYIRATRQRTL